MEPANLLLIMADEHSRRVLGCYGHSLVKTPNLDRLAARGTRFPDAYCNSPICVPSRASFATGRYVHQIRRWDNATPYDGSVPSWAHRVRAQQHPCTAFGKLHYRRTEDDNGFDEEVMPLHIAEGVGDLLGLIRDNPPVRSACLRLAETAGPGNSDYQDYDAGVATAAGSWLRSTAPKLRKPWVLFVSFACPHYPLVARQEFYDLYSEQQISMPELYAAAERPDHPYIRALRECMVFDRAFDERRMRRAIAAYFALVTFVDQNIGQLLRALDMSGLADTTRVIYTSDHGDNLGARGLWGKSTFYEESAGVPLIMAGPDIPRNSVCREPVSLVDLFPTILDCVGAEVGPEDRDLPGRSLFDVMRGIATSRPVFCEYHAAGAITGAFMVRHQQFKLMHYVGMPPMLFDLERDPGETTDLASHPEYRQQLHESLALLRTIVDPEHVDRLARADQQARIAEAGGRDAIIERGGFGASPVPGKAPMFARLTSEQR
jgi:choline-sulfatase